ncbi:MAG: hypothetical protein R2864_06980 [Syntrophotaleaceae bacterium]
MQVDFNDNDDMVMAVKAALSFCEILKQIYKSGQLLPESSLLVQLKFEEALSIAENRCQKALEARHGGSHRRGFH